MKKITVAFLVLSAFLIPSVAGATPSSVNRVVDHIEPLIQTDFVKAPYFTATSTSNSTLPFYLFTNATGTAATTTNFFSTLGNFNTLCIALDCKTAWPAGLTAYDAWTHPLAGQSATTSLMLFNGGMTFTLATGTSATTTNFFSTTASTTNLQVGNTLGIGSSTPFTSVALGLGKTITVTARVIATSTSMTVSWLDGNQQTVRIGTSATAISFSNYVPGQTLLLEICNPGSSGGAVTFSGVLWPGGTAPTTTTTANKCDLVTFRAGNGTSTPIVYGGYNQSY